MYSRNDHHVMDSAWCRFDYGGGSKKARRSHLSCGLLFFSPAAYYRTVDNPGDRGETKEIRTSCPSKMREPNKTSAPSREHGLSVKYAGFKTDGRRARPKMNASDWTAYLDYIRREPFISSGRPETAQKNKKDSSGLLPSSMLSQITRARKINW